MSLEAFGDEGLEGISHEDLLNAGLNCDEEEDTYWEYEGEPMTFSEACEWLENKRSSFLED